MFVVFEKNGVYHVELRLLSYSYTERPNNAVLSSQISVPSCPMPLKQKYAMVYAA